MVSSAKSIVEQLGDIYGRSLIFHRNRRGVVVDVTTLEMARKTVKLQKENPAECAGEGKQTK